MMESHYSINVARKRQGFWVHYFRVDMPGSIERAREVRDDLREKFPECEVTMRYWSYNGYDVED